MSVITTKDGIKYEGENSGSLDNFNVYTKTESDASYVKLPTVDATQLIDLIYPIGSIYMSVTQTSPASFLGGTWTALEEGKALWTTTTASTGGATIDAGLPNITGSFQVGRANASYWDIVGAYGAFNYTDYGTSFKLSYASMDNRASYQTASFNASSGEQKTDGTISNDVYGKSDTVQPPAIRVYAWQRAS